MFKRERIFLQKDYQREEGNLWNFVHELLNVIRKMILTCADVVQFQEHSFTFSLTTQSPQRGS